MQHISYGADGSASSLRVVEGPDPKAGPGQILIRVQYAGVNRPDVLQRQGGYAPPPGASPILGLEVAGSVAAVGSGVSDWHVGDAVCALVPGGGYAEYCVTSARHALPIPQGLTLAEAASLPEVWFTVWANLVDLGSLAARERLLVQGGSSGIGLAAIQLGRLRGAEVLVTVGNAEKGQFCQSYGAAAAIDYHREDFAKRVLELTGGEGVDVVLDMVGAPYLAANMRCLRRDGRLILIGFLQGSRGDIDLWSIISKRLRLTGSTMRPRSVEEKAAIRDALLEHVWPAFADGRVRTHVYATFPLARAAEAHQLMESSRHIGKIVLSV
jgi:putative PIG3 family NAD(P)H quinone oxidoreductase